MNKAAPPPKADTNGSIAPHSENAEQAVFLSTLYAEPVDAERALTEITQADYYEPKRKRLWPEMQAFFQQYGNLDERNFTDWLERRGEADLHGGKIGIGRLYQDAAVRRVVTDIDAEIHAVKTWTRKRQLWEIGLKLSRRDVDPGELLATLRKDVDALEGQSSVLSLAQCSAGVRLKDPATFAPATFYKTGYSGLDRGLGGGLGAGEATSLFAPSAMGKSAFMVNLALAQARQGTPVPILSLEMSEDSIWKLAVGIEAGIPRLHIRHNSMTTIESSKFAEALAQLSGWPLFVLDRRRFPVDPAHAEAPTMQAVGSLIRDGVRQYGWRVIFLDYLAKVGPFDADDLVRIPRLTNWCFDTAQRTGAHIVALAQSNKAGFARRDTKSKKRGIALEDSKGSIEVVADMDNVIGLIRDDWNSEEPQDFPEMRAVVLKCRQGPAGSCRLIFDKAIGRILEAEKHEDGAASSER